MALLAFLAAPAKTDAQSVQTLPVFKRKWWYSSQRLDARPVIWSLDNRPEEWEQCDIGTVYASLLHKPSRHFVWCGRSITMGIMHAHDCSCSDRDWQPFQIFAVRRAIRRWFYAHGRRPVELAEQFSSHFIR